MGRRGGRGGEGGAGAREERAGEERNRRSERSPEAVDPLEREVIEYSSRKRGKKKGDTAGHHRPSKSTNTF